MQALIRYGAKNAKDTVRKIFSLIFVKLLNEIILLFLKKHDKEFEYVLEDTIDFVRALQIPGSHEVFIK